MLRADLEAAGIPYRDPSGLVFDFHALRCQTATLADTAGVSTRVVQKMMRHSTLELTGRYTRPRVVDAEAASFLRPTLKPESDESESMVMTGTDANPAPFRTATQSSTKAVTYEFKSNVDKIVATNEQRFGTPLLEPGKDGAA